MLSRAQQIFASGWQDKVLSGLLVISTPTSVRAKTNVALHILAICV